jgi:predicted solute-binding protein
VTVPLRLGAVGYLNARPLVHGLEAGRGRSVPVEVLFDVPSVCARRLADGEVDLGLIPSISYLDRPGDCVVPDVSIASDGAVASVAVFTRRPAREIRTVALDTSSRTSAVLMRILCARQFEIAPAFVPHAPDLTAMLASADAALLIGDPALFADPRAVGAEKLDLGLQWAGFTGLPFVWAFWAGRADAADGAVVRLLQEARDAGVRASDAVADAYCADDASRQAVARAYLRENMRYGLSERELRGLSTFYREAMALGLAPPARVLRFYPSDVSSA